MFVIAATWSPGPSTGSTTPRTAIHVTRTYDVLWLIAHPCIDLAQIINVRTGEDGEPEFYIHYVNRTHHVHDLYTHCIVDKRMDEWVKEDKFLSTEEAPDLDDESDEAAASHGGPMTRNQRRKIHQDHGGIV